MLRYILWADDRYDGVNPLTALYGEVKILKSMLAWITRPGVRTGIISSEFQTFSVVGLRNPKRRIAANTKTKNTRKQSDLPCNQNTLAVKTISAWKQSLHVPLWNHFNWSQHGNGLRLVAHTQAAAMYHTDACSPLISVMFMSPTPPKHTTSLSNRFQPFPPNIHLLLQLLSFSSPFPLLPLLQCQSWIWMTTC